MLKKYAFDYPEEAAVECAELDTFLADIDEVLKKHGVGLKIDGWESVGAGFIRLVPYKDHESDIFTDQLSEYRGGVPWLDRAKAAFLQKKEEIYAKCDAEQEEKAKAKRQAVEDKMLRDGLTLGGKRYKLVEE